VERDDEGFYPDYDWPMALNYVGFVASAYWLGFIGYVYQDYALDYTMVFSVPIFMHYMLQSFGNDINPYLDSTVYKVFEMTSLIVVDPIGLTLFGEGIIGGVDSLMGHHLEFIQDA